jgi:hypothetical protein
MGVMRQVHYDRVTGRFAKIVAEMKAASFGTERFDAALCMLVGLLSQTDEMELQARSLRWASGEGITRAELGSTETTGPDLLKSVEAIKLVIEAIKILHRAEESDHHKEVDVLLPTYEVVAWLNKHAGSCVVEEYFPADWAISCPVCHSFSVQQEYDICADCGWEDDHLSRSDEFTSLNANHVPFGAFKEFFQQTSQPFWVFRRTWKRAYEKGERDGRREARQDYAEPPVRSKAR